MRSVGTIVVVALCLALGASEVLPAAPADGGAYHIVLPRQVLGPGETVELRLVPPPPPGVRVNYGTMIGTMGVGFVDGVYRAPYVIPSGTPPVRVTASFSASGFRASATAEVDLAPGSVEGAADCLGPGQSFSTVMADIAPDYVQLDELPNVVRGVEPEYPRSAFVRGVEDTIVVKVLVCKSGRVLDAYALPRFRDTRAGSEPIEHDPKVVEAAVVAVRQYIFTPGKKSGQAFAVWVNTAITFRR